MCVGCREGHIGDRCEACAIGYFGDPQGINTGEGTSSPLPTSTSPYSSPSFLLPCFSSGFFALPPLLSGPPGTPVPCARCQCNDNVDPLECEPIEGSCHRCLFNTSGRQCEMCAPGFYGDAITAKNCTGNVVLQTSKRKLRPIMLVQSEHAFLLVSHV